MAIHIFTRDLRIKDNTSLNVIGTFCPVFIFTPEQVTNNKYKSDNAVQFMVDSLEDLNLALSGKLGLFYGDYETIVNSIIRKTDIKKISITQDYTPYAIKRETMLKRVCKRHDIELLITADYCLNEPGKVYQKFTPYKNQHKTPRVPKTSQLKAIKIQGNFDFKKAHKLYKNKATKHGGRKNGLKRLALIKTKSKEYGNTRNTPAIDSSELSAYIKFGCISVREVYWAIHNSEALRSQLIWRDFFFQLGFNFPVLSSPLRERYKKMKWDNDRKLFNYWKTGTTGFPIVDAGMRQLNETGFMHNRLRLITASFLVKTLLIDWRMGEHYFATKLYDYDPLVNNGNWQWVAGCGADSQPYFRIFNPWLQSHKHDRKCIYIKHWIPELKNIEPHHIHKWYIHHTPDYIEPIVDFDKQKKKVLAAYKKIYS